MALTLIKLQEIIRRFRGPLIVLGGMILVLAGWAIFRIRQVPVLADLNLTFETAPLGEGLDTRNLALPGDIPAGAKIYEIEERNLTTAEIDQIAQAFAISSKQERVEEPDGTITYAYQANGRTLDFRSDPWGVKYITSDYTLEEIGLPGSLPDEERAKTLASDYLNRVDPNRNESLELSIRYLNVQGESLGETTEETANYLAVTYQMAVESREIFQRAVTASVLLNKRSEIVFLNYLFPPTLREFTQGQLAAAKVVAEQLQEVGEVVWVDPYTAGITVQEVTSLDGFRPQTVQLVFVETVGKLLEPAYLFEGSGRANGVESAATVLAPARILQD